ncbi:MAG TPA: hypothetical protein VHG08_17590 [Longimicrobium sp.]|nr:hypothetical protein [Longimicrobium sp.]
MASEHVVAPPAAPALPPDAPAAATPHPGEKLAMETLVKTLSPDRLVPSNELSIREKLSSVPQRVHDELDAPSALCIGRQTVVAGEELMLDLLQVDDGHAVPVLGVHSDTEASIQLANARSRSPWRIGAGGPAGPDGFYIANRERGIVLSFTDDGVTLAGLPPAPEGARLETVQVDPETGRLYRA